MPKGFEYEQSFLSPDNSMVIYVTIDRSEGVMMVSTDANDAIKAMLTDNYSYTQVWQNGKMTDTFRMGD